MFPSDKIFLTQTTDPVRKIKNDPGSMISIINRDYVYEKVNTGFCLAHKIDPADLVGRSLRDIWGENVFSTLLRHNLDLCFNGKTISYEACFSTPGTGKHFFEVIFSPLRTGSGSITHILAETFDIDDLKRTEKNNGEFSEMGNLPVGFVRVETDGRIIHVNRAFLKIVECDEEQVRRSGLSSFYPSPDLLKTHIDQLNGTGMKCFGIIPVRNVRGEEIPCRISGYISTSETGGVSLIDFSFQDASRELMLESRLLQAQKLETIGALAGGIAHDFNNILTTISGYTEMLKEDLPSGSEVDIKVGGIQSALNKARSLINQILTFSRQVEQEKIPVNVADVVRETISFVKSSIPRNISLKSNIREESPEVLADPTQLFRVFLNLMTNAIQAMEGCGGSLSVEMDVISGEILKGEISRSLIAETYVLVNITDTGIGMEPTHMSRIFEPFYTTREVGKGTGLGLSVIHGIITELEGEILVSSKKGEGSSFKVYLPASSEVLTDNAEGRIILLISDNRHESRLLSLGLGKKGYRMLHATDSVDFLRLLEESDPEIIIYIADNQSISIELFSEIISRKGVDIPCIFIGDTGHELSRENPLFLQIVKQKIQKPVSLKEIISAIENVINF